MKQVFDKIYIDLDGVLADFQPHADKVTAMYYGEEFKYHMRDFLKHGATEEARQKYWIAMERYQEETGRGFWEELDLLPDAHELIEFIDSTEIPSEILTATGDPKYGAPEQKVRWVNRHFGDRVVNTVRRGPMKADFAHPKSVLIDDTDYSCIPFEEAGGVAILHRTTEETIEQFERMIHVLS